MMNNEVYFRVPGIENSDLSEFRSSKCADNTEFEIIDGYGMIEIDPNIAQCIFVFLQNISYAAAYDLIKFCVLKVWKILARKKKDTPIKDTCIKVEVSDKDAAGNISNQREITIKTSYEMGDEERERILEQALKSVLAAKAD